jgi:hypothetical protein
MPWMRAFRATPGVAKRFPTMLANQHREVCRWQSRDDQVLVIGVGIVADHWYGSNKPDPALDPRKRAC